LALEILVQVLGEIDELQSGADGIALGKGVGILDTEQSKNNAAHGIGRAAAVVEHRWPVREGLKVGILLEGGEQGERL
jgi:hypothetical protein